MSEVKIEWNKTKENSNYFSEPRLSSFVCSQWSITLKLAHTVNVAVVLD